MGERVGQQGLATQDDEVSEKSVGESDQRAGEQRSLHERVAERLYQRGDKLGIPVHRQE